MMNQRDIRIEQRISALEQKVFGNKTEQKADGPRTQAGTERRGPKIPPGGNGNVGVDLNAADAKAIAAAIYGVGPKTADDIVAQRDSGGPFKSFEDLAERVGGVSLEQLKQAQSNIRLG